MIMLYNDRLVMIVMICGDMPPALRNGKSNSYNFLYSGALVLDIDPQDMNFSANVSGMAISSTEDELSEDGGCSAQGNRKHIIYQSCLGELLMKVTHTCAILCIHTYII